MLKGGQESVIRGQEGPEQSLLVADGEIVMAQPWVGRMGKGERVHRLSRGGKRGVVRGQEGRT